MLNIRLSWLREALERRVTADIISNLTADTVQGCSMKTLNRQVHPLNYKIVLSRQNIDARRRAKKANKCV